MLALPPKNLKRTYVHKNRIVTNTILIMPITVGQLFTRIFSLVIS